MHCFSGKWCSEFPERMHFCIGILKKYDDDVVVSPGRTLKEEGGSRYREASLLIGWIVRFDLVAGFDLDC